MFKVILISRAEREFGKLPHSLQIKLYQEFNKLEQYPFGLNVKNIKGVKNGYRLRVGRYRVLFVIFTKEKLIKILDIFLKKGDNDYARRKILF
ncbi:MAG: type II toxin-antitoxin system RelE/ParE family toxin [bacterium]